MKHEIHSNSKVQVKEEKIFLPTYEPIKPEKLPMFLDRRVYQGSSGKIYPLPQVERISNEKKDREWQAVILENDFIEVMVLPEIGGRIHSAKDKSNGYDFIYRQDVIKPALVGLAGPWLSGGIEFNWPQHHRPGTFMPVEYEIEHEEDGSVTLWLSDEDPLQAMKGMHGVCLYPDRSLIELKVRAYNRTDKRQTFLWWANVATQVHEDYQSFFPEDVTHVADHAKRAHSTFPLCSDHYYGVDYGTRAKEGVAEEFAPEKFKPSLHNSSTCKKYAANDLSWYANIPVPTSYMCIGSNQDHFGGYDHKKNAGIVHVANHHIAPGKKQWTWGNHNFGYAWDKNLSDSAEPYIELMAGVYTDNQPDFSYLMPGETKVWKQHWYPVKNMNTPNMADEYHALSLSVEGKEVCLSVNTTYRAKGLKITLLNKNETVLNDVVELSPAESYQKKISFASNVVLEDICVIVENICGVKTIYQKEALIDQGEPDAATEPSDPKTIESTDELYITGMHLEQYRHATRKPEPYYQEALSRDPGDSRCNHRMGFILLQKGEAERALSHFLKAKERITRRNPNPADGELLYDLGRCYLEIGQEEEAYAAFYKATWNQAWVSEGRHALARIDAKNKRWLKAFEHLQTSLKFNQEHLKARCLMVMVLKEMGSKADAKALLEETLAIDPLYTWTRYLNNGSIGTDIKAMFNLAMDLHHCGYSDQAIEILTAVENLEQGALPRSLYLKASIQEELDKLEDAKSLREQASLADSTYYFPFGRDERIALEKTLQDNPNDAQASYYLGNLYYDCERKEEALELWQNAVSHNPDLTIAWRNLGMALYNVQGKEDEALKAFDRALSLEPESSRLFYEKDQLLKRIGAEPKLRLEAMEKNIDLISQRDDLCLEMVDLLIFADRIKEAKELLLSRDFQPWEGGEGIASSLYHRIQRRLGHGAIKEDNPTSAVKAYQAALRCPENLGEDTHLLVNQADLFYDMGLAYSKLNNEGEAKRWWRLSSEYRSDFQGMENVEFSEMTYYSALSLMAMGKKSEAKELFEDLMTYAKKEFSKEAKVDYFATSLPTLLLFEENLQKVQERRARFIEAQAHCGLGNYDTSKELCNAILKSDPSNGKAFNFLQEIELQSKKSNQ